jgi:3D (Asp-Asp-Asp) domain-containing protein
MSATLDDYKAEVDVDGARGAVYEEHEAGSGEISGAEEDASSTSETTAGNGEDEYVRGTHDESNDTSAGTSEITWLTFESTAYIALCDTGCSGITFTGVDVRSSIYYEGDRVIAVDPAVIPLGSRVEVRLADGATFTARAIDTGGAINGHIIDLLVETEAEAWAFGRQSVELRILDE